MKLYQKRLQACLLAGVLCLQGCSSSQNTKSDTQVQTERPQTTDNKESAALEHEVFETEDDQSAGKQSETDDSSSQNSQTDTESETLASPFNNTVDGAIQIRKDKISWLEERRMSGPLVGWALANYFLGNNLESGITLDTMASMLGTTNEVGTYLVDMAKVLSAYIPQDFPDEGAGTHRYECVMLETGTEVSAYSDSDFLESVHCSLNHGLPVVVIADESALFSNGGGTAFMILTGAQEADGLPVSFQFLAPSVDENVHVTSAANMLTAMKTGSYFAYMRHIFYPVQTYSPDIPYDFEKAQEYFSGQSSTVTSTPSPDYSAALKPVVYLYPEKETDVSVKLSLSGSLDCTYPAYNNGWNVRAKPDGQLTDSKGQTYSYLYWEATLDADYDMSQGFCIRGKDSAAFLEQALAALGLNRKEANEFIVFWLPQMEANEWNIISFQSQAYTDAARLDITPAPDSLIRVFMTWKPSSQKVTLTPQTLSAPERSGFTVVEWGGSRLD